MRISPQLISGISIIVWISAFLHRDWSMMMMTTTPPLSPISSKVKHPCTASFSSPITVTWKNDSTYLVNLMTYVVQLVLHSPSLSLRLQGPSGQAKLAQRVLTVSGLMTTRISQNTIPELTYFYNNSLHCWKVPELWTDAFIGPVPKPAEDHRCLKGHRITVVQNVIGKIPEKIRARRFTRHTELECVLPPDMGAYRPHKETWINPATVAANIWDGFEEKDNTLLVALDLEDAYNRIQLPILVDRMLQLGISVFWASGSCLHSTPEDA